MASKLTIGMPQIAASIASVRRLVVLADRLGLGVDPVSSYLAISASSFLVPVALPLQRTCLTSANVGARALRDSAYATETHYVALRSGELSRLSTCRQ